MAMQAEELKGRGMLKDRAAAYKHYLEILRFYVKGVDVARSLSLELYDLCSDKDLKLFVGSFLDPFRAYNIDKIKLYGRQSVLQTIGLDARPNHSQISDFVYNEIKNRTCLYVIKDLRWKYCFHPLLISKVFYHVYKALKGTDLSLGNRFVLFTIFQRMVNTSLLASKTDFGKVDKYVSLMSSAGCENILTQYFNQNGIPTVTLTDGVYMDYGTNPPVDSINYLNFTSKEMILWGDYSKKEYEKLGICSERLRVGGYPSGVKKQCLKQNNEYKECVVLLARNSYEKSNLSLLKLVSKISGDYNFYLKLHPSNPEDLYREISETYSLQLVNKSESIKDCLDPNKYDFCIAVNTTAYYEAFINGLPCIRFVDGSFLVMNGLDDTFSTHDQLVVLLNRLKQIKTDDYQTLVDNMLKDSIGFSENEYRNIILGDLR